jgi:hypothetical protein
VDEYVTELEWTIAHLGEPKVMLPGFIKYLKASGAFTKKDIPFKLNLILLPPNHHVINLPNHNARAALIPITG